MSTKPLKLVDPLTPEMIKAGVDELRQFSFGRPEEQIVEAVYLAMEYARRASLKKRIMRTCYCGSGLPRRELHDAAGIFCTFVCDKCERKRRAEFKAALDGNSDYAVSGEEIDIGRYAGKDY